MRRMNILNLLWHIKSQCRLVKYKATSLILYWPWMSTGSGLKVFFPWAFHKQFLFFSGNDCLQWYSLDFQVCTTIKNKTSRVLVATYFNSLFLSNILEWVWVPHGMQNGHTFSTGAITFANNYALQANAIDIPTRDITVEFWARTSAYTFQNNEHNAVSDILDIATHAKSTFLPSSFYLACSYLMGQHPGFHFKTQKRTWYSRPRCFK